MIAITLLALILSTSVTFPAAAQQCDDFDSCTANDMCADGECVGTPANGGSCDDNNPCTINDTCISGICSGTPAPTGTSCNGGCGTCQAFVPGLPALCLPPLDGGSTDGQPCNDNFACTINDVCQSGLCFGTFRQCPDSDGNPCTADFCNPETGQCQATTFPPCAPCQTCRATGGSTFACDPAANGTACDDFNECTASSMCSAGECVAGIPSGPTPTATTAVGPPTATVTQSLPTATSSVPTSTPGGTLCVGDCDGDDQVSVDEIVRAVNIALGNLATSVCPGADGNSDGFITVDEIVTAVNNALNGCR